MDKKFNVMDELMQACEESLKSISSISGLPAAQHKVATKWFVHGLNGPFGSVSPVPNIFFP